MDADDLLLRVSTCTYNKSAATGSGNSYTKSNPREIAGWTGVALYRGIERCPSGFEIEFTEPSGSVAEMIVQPGDFCEVFLGSDKVLTGYVDRYMPSYSQGQHTVAISGRSKCQDLIDCASFPGGEPYRQVTLQSLAQTLCQPYGITVSTDNGVDPGVVYPIIVVMEGEASFEVLERLSRNNGVLLYDDVDGNLVISAIGTKQASSGFEEGVNVLSAAAMYSMDGRFSHYGAFLNSLNIYADEGNGAFMRGVVRDPGVPRFRWRAIVSEVQVGGTQLAVKRMEWEATRRLGRSFQVRLRTDSWRDSSGALYAPNTLAAIDLPGLKLQPKVWLISDVVYRRDSRGTTCDLTIMPPEAFDVMPDLIYAAPPDINRVN